MITDDKQFPDTAEELLAECEALSDKYDLYDLGRPRNGKWRHDQRPDGTEVGAGEYQYGVAMIPAQWVIHVLGKREEQ
ncbi:hypothetical protein [Adlercreutzia sp. ZJ242]|uniref:hypothetical protein n=1 Tax=Adlercreutzia sp. ZJ242 TaxID=2709409 RepID=UPI0013EAA1F8|nr:hypothetical protein [Adlercreutzia sp. ZJ242]